MKSKIIIELDQSSELHDLKEILENWISDRDYGTKYPLLEFAQDLLSDLDKM